MTFLFIFIFLIIQSTTHFCSTNVNPQNVITLVNQKIKPLNLNTTQVTKLINNYFYESEENLHNTFNQFNLPVNWTENQIDDINTKNSINKLLNPTKILKTQTNLFDSMQNNIQIENHEEKIVDLICKFLSNNIDKQYNEKYFPKVKVANSSIIEKLKELKKTIIYINTIDTKSNQNPTDTNLDYQSTSEEEHSTPRFSWVNTLGTVGLIGLFVYCGYKIFPHFVLLKNNIIKNFPQKQILEMLINQQTKTDISAETDANENENKNKTISNDEKTSSTILDDIPHNNDIQNDTIEKQPENTLDTQIVPNNIVEKMPERITAPTTIELIKNIDSMRYVSSSFSITFLLAFAAYLTKNQSDDGIKSIDQNHYSTYRTVFRFGVATLSVITAGIIFFKTIQ